MSRGHPIPLSRIAVLLAVLSGGPALGFDLQGHRGARGLLPENTLPAFEHALAIGVSTLETDLAVTLDGVVVLSHDPVLNPDITRGPDGKWIARAGPPIKKLALAELERYDVGRIRPFSAYSIQLPAQVAIDGARIPTLAALFDLARASGKSPRFNMETKISPLSPAETPDAETFARLTVEAVRAAGMQGRTTVQSFDWRTLVAVKRMAPEIETSCLTVQSVFNDTIGGKGGAPSPWLAGLDLKQHGGSLPRLVKAAGCGTWSPYFKNLTRRNVAEAHALGLKVLPWTVNSTYDLRSMLDLGVDGLISDYPDRALKVITARGLTVR